MKTKKVKNIIKLITCIVFLSGLALAETINAQEEDKTESPYFQVISENDEAGVLPLKSTKADVSIAGVIAEVKITQEYQNTGESPIEAIYVFPGSTNAAVHFMKMTIGEREIFAQIQETQKARQQYEEAKNQGKAASLLEQKRPNVFQMNVANTIPG